MDTTTSVCLLKIQRRGGGGRNLDVNSLTFNFMFDVLISDRKYRVPFRIIDDGDPCARHFNNVSLKTLHKILCSILLIKECSELSRTVILFGIS